LSFWAQRITQNASLNLVYVSDTDVVHSWRLVLGLETPPSRIFYCIGLALRAALRFFGITLKIINKLINSIQ